MRADPTPSAATNVGLYDLPGLGQLICVFIKRTYDMVGGQRMRRSARGEVPLFLEPTEDDDDLYPTACLVHETDLAPRKPCTDIVVHGHVRSPGGVPLNSMSATVRVGMVTKRIAVLGDRRVRWRPGARPVFEPPAPFVEIPLSWRRAFGGIDGSVHVAVPADLTDLLRALSPEEHPGAYPRNPAGTGWVVNADARSIDGLSLPNFEDPRHLLSPDRLIHGTVERWPAAPVPAGFGWLGQTWFPRSSLLGIGPELPESLRAGWLADAPALDEGPDPRFFSGASSGLRAIGLRGDELVELHGLHHEGPLPTALPDDAPAVTITFDRQPLETVLRLHTIEVFADQRALTMLWVAEARPPRQLPRRLPVGDVDCFDVLEGVDAIVDGAVVARGGHG